MKETLKIPSISNISNGLTSTTSSFSSPFKIMYIFIIIIILIIVSLFFFYKDQILKFFDSVFNRSNTSKVDGENDKSESDTVVTESDKIDNIPAKIDDIDKKVNTLVSNSHSHDPAVKTLNNKLNNISPYKESNVTSDGFCYIGYDDGQRECVDVYQGDVCMSGEIFPSLDICINPKLRS
jgi:cytoskeletal protein RodZ